MNRLVRLTPERLEKAKTPKGGYKASQLKILGVDYPPKKGWKKELEGKKISLGDFIAFVTKGKNTEYLEQIKQSLPLLNPPVMIPSVLGNDKKKLKQPKLSKKEQKEIKRLQLKNARVERIKVFGIHSAVNLLKDKCGQSLKCTGFINKILKTKEEQVDYTDIVMLYSLLKRYGVILSSRANGTVTSSSFTGITKVRKSQYLYIIRATKDDLCKIGVSQNPKKRLKQVQTGCPYVLKLSKVFSTQKNAVSLEGKLHKHFKKFRLNGEWFAGLSDDQIQSVIGDRGEIVSHY